MPEEAELDLSLVEEEEPAQPPRPPAPRARPADVSGRKPVPPPSRPKAPAREEPSIQPRARQAPPPPPSLRPGTPVAPARVAATKSGVGSPAYPDLTAELRSLEESLALGFDDEAQETAAELLARHPSHPILLAKLNELGLSVGEAPPAAEPPPSYRSRPSPVAPLPTVSDDEPDLDLGLAEPPSARATIPAAAPVPPLEEDGYDLGDELGVAEEEPGLNFDLPEEEPSAVASTSSFEDELGLGPEPSFGAEEPSEFEEPAVAEAGSLADLGSDLDSLLGGVSDAESVAQSAALGGSSFLEESGLADMFQEFKKGVDRQLGHEDYETRYNLGIAYKEMGLVDEAIGEFQLAARDEARFLDCASMLGLCFLEKGMPEVAITWFERGLEAPGRNEEEYLGLRLELARALEAAGDRDQALDALMDLQQALEARRHSDPQLEKRLREVSERIMALGGGRT